MRKKTKITIDPKYILAVIAVVSILLFHFVSMTKWHRYSQQLAV